MAISREKAERFLDELASMTYDLRTKHGIPQEDFFMSPSVRIDEHVSLPDAFKNVSAE